MAASGHATSNTPMTNAQIHLIIANILIISEKTDAKWILIFQTEEQKKKAGTDFPVISLELHSIVL